MNSKESKYNFFFRTLLYFLILFLLTTNSLLFSEDQSPPVQTQTQEPVPVVRTGFYKGAILASLYGGSVFQYGGSMISREKDIQENIGQRASLGLTSSKIFDTINVPLGFSVPGSQFFPKGTSRGSIEYGISDNVGLGISISRFSMDVTNNLEMQDVRVLSTQSFNYNNFTYIEMVPNKRNFYSDTILSFGGYYHLFSKSRFDPYAYLEGGIIFFHSASRRLKQNYLFDYSSGDGRGFGGRAGFGINIYFIPALGIKLEVSHQKRWVQSTITGLVTLDTTQIEAGIFMNFETTALKARY